MQAEAYFSVVSKEIDNKDSQAVSANHEVHFRLQKEGSVSIKHSGTIGRNQLNSTLEAILLQMHIGDRWTLTDNQSAKFSIEVIAIGNKADLQGPREEAESLKAQGNALIKAKKYSQAAKKYVSAHGLIVNDIDPTSEGLKLNLSSNLALAYLNSGDYAAALEWCQIHLQESLQPNLKVIYRKASANKALKRWESAREDIRFGIDQSKGDQDSAKNFQQLLAGLDREQKEQKLKDKAFYGKMLG